MKYFLNLKYQELKNFLKQILPTVHVFPIQGQEYFPPVQNSDNSTHFFPLLLSYIFLILSLSMI